MRNSVKKIPVYTFDWDDNILHMPTKIKMDKKVGDSWEPLDVDPAEFALIRGDKENYRIRNNDPVQAFDEFVDFGPRGDNAFFEDVLIALNKNDYGPSWEIFIGCLKEANLFSIVTSRSHEFSSIRRSIEYIIDLFSMEDKKEMYINCCNFGLNDLELDSLYAYEMRNRVEKLDFTNNFSKNGVISHYLNKCKYYGVGLPFSNSFKEEFNIDDTLKVSIQEAKKMALGKMLSISDEMFTKIYNNGDLEVFNLGFSDDDKKTTELIKDFFSESSKSFRGSKLCVYDTSDRKIKGGNKTKYFVNYKTQTA